MLNNPNNRLSAVPTHGAGGNVTTELQALDAELARAEVAAANLFSRVSSVLLPRNDECVPSGCEPGQFRCEVANVVAAQGRRVSSLARLLEELVGAVDL